MDVNARKNRLCMAQDFCLGLWVIAHAFASLCVVGAIQKPSLWNQLGDSESAKSLAALLIRSELPIVLLILAGAFAYVPFVHWLDKRFECSGIQAMLLPWKDSPRHRTPPKELQERTNLRIHTITIMFGFSATIFVLCIDLYNQTRSMKGYPTYIIMTMAFCFLLASLLTLVQLVLYDALFNPNINKVPEILRTDIRGALQQKIRRLRLWSWQLLVAPAILGTLLINEWLAIAVNFIYGLLLYHYYFLPREVAFRIIGATEKPLPPAKASGELV